MLMDNFHTIILLIIIVKVHGSLTKENQFNRSYIGVVFSPYIKNRVEDGSIPQWKNYSSNDVKYMLNLTASKFLHISTFSMGAGRANETWETGDVVGLTASVAAEINAENGNKLLSLVEGIWHSSTIKLRDLEAHNAIEAAVVANRIYPGTVSGLVLTSMSWMDYYRSWKDAITFLNEIRPKVHAVHLELGIRLDICDQIRLTRHASGIENLSPSINNDKETQGEVLTDIQMIARDSDFLICVQMPPANAVGNGVASTVETLGNTFLELEKRFIAVNPNLTITWETGWPSFGVSRFGSENSARNLQGFWAGMNSWSTKWGRLVYMYSAFDEPWRTNPNKDITDPEGPNGGDSHFGWWTLVDNNNIHSIIEKVPEPVAVPDGGFPTFEVSGAVLGVLLIVIAILVWRLYKAKTTIDRLTEQDIKDFYEGVAKKSGEKSDDIVQNALHLPYDQSFELSKDAIIIDELELLGEGAFGSVYKGRIKGVEELVAFKKPHSNVSATQLKNLLAEIKIMIYIGGHENIVRLLGAYTQGMREGQLYIASECCGMGSLEAHLRSIPRNFVVAVDESAIPIQMKTDEVRYANFTRKPIVDYANAPASSVQVQVPMSSLLRWSYEIANGMAYLGTKNIVHADLAARNVLLTSEGVSKISDFGLSRRLYEYTQYVKASQEPLPWRWMALESLKNLTFSTYTDVWSYGVLLWEIFTLGDLPYPGRSWEVDFVNELEAGLRMSKPKYANDEIFKLILECWNPEPKQRPAFKDLKNYFESAYYEGGKLEKV